MSKKEKKPRRVRCSTCKQLRDPSSLNGQGQCTTCRKTAQNAKPECGKTEKKRIAEEVLEAAKQPLPFDNSDTPVTKQTQDTQTMTQTGTTGDATTTAETSDIRQQIEDYKDGMQRYQSSSILSDRIKQENSKPIVKQKLQPTEEQQAILEAVQQCMKDKSILMVEAGAGCGKTATLRMLADVLSGIGQYTAFNTSLVAESKAKFQGTRVACNTTHSLAFRAEGKRFAHRLNQGRVRADRLAKMLDIEELVLTIGEVVDEKTKQTKSMTKRLSPGWMASQVMGAIRRFCQSADKQVVADHFRYVDGIDLPKDGHRTYENNNQLREYLLPYAEDAWRDLSDPDGQLPFNHDHYVKIWELNNPTISADYIMIDELQDTAKVLISILQQQIDKPNPPVLIGVGDSAQQIYEWRGAVNALDSFPNANRLFLSQSFRFGEAIANLANKVLETLEEPTPLRLKGLPSIPSKIVPIAKPRAILCRTNALAVASLLEAIAEGRKPFLVGGGSDVIAFVEAAKNLQQLQPTGHPELACFSSWCEVQEYVKTDEDGADLKLLVKLIDGFGADTILSALRAMPEEKDADLVISTAHRSKGREWDSVRLASDFPTASKCCDADRKLLYVAVTRAKLQLDVGDCPFFTGNDSLSIDSILSGQNKPTPTEILPPTPSTPPALTTFTWSKSTTENAWLIRGPSGHTGETVDVERKDGSKSKKRLGSAVQEVNGIATYRAI